MPAEEGVELSKCLRTTNQKKKKNVSKFIDTGCSLNSISEELAEALNISVHEDVNDTIEVDLSFV
ncbi:hypothetical protein PsorP6_010880 [Peronosclerospora sorghi]|uniref:Uncharacterized protein n=1 Tax=Peronosclerospora sorghi TaxID=230839 RepID=A0ACC0VYF3_9STRA|nr:hypothetical protein PsorP6_010880 [Peronosclerospora sorghi]